VRDVIEVKNVVTKLELFSVYRMNGRNKQISSCRGKCPRVHETWKKGAHDMLHSLNTAAIWKQIN